MFALLSPAKKLVDSQRQVELSQPALMEDTLSLAAVMKGQSPADLGTLMSISEKLSQLNFERFQVFQDSPGKEDLSPAALTFAGDTYVGFDGPSMSDEDLRFAQEHIGILSGLYGVLRPLDGIQPYRLEMGTKLETSRGKNLYQFWGQRITDRINACLGTHQDKTVVNLASNEYFSSIDQKALTGPVLTPVFKEVRNGKAKVISFMAKKARGAMARYIVDNRLTSPEGMKAFTTGGYAFDESLSDASTWVFLRAS